MPKHSFVLLWMKSGVQLGNEESYKHAWLEKVIKQAITSASNWMPVDFFLPMEPPTPLFTF